MSFNTQAGEYSRVNLQIVVVHSTVEQAERIAMYLGTSQAIHKKTAHVESTQTVS
jgi:hypothetical protein